MANPSRRLNLDDLTTPMPGRSTPVPQTFGTVYQGTVGRPVGSTAQATMHPLPTGGQQELQQFRLRVVAQENQIKKERQMRLEAEEKMKTIASKLASLEQEKAEILRTTKTTNDEVVKKGKLEDRIHLMSTQITELKSQLEAEQLRALNAEKTTSTIRDEANKIIEKWQSRDKVQECKLDELTQECQKLQNTVDTLSLQLAERDSRIQKAELNLERQAAMSEKQTEELQAKAAEIEGLRRKMDDVMCDVRRKEGELYAAYEDQSKQTSASEMMSNEVRNCREKIQVLERTIDSLKQSIAATENQNQALTDMQSTHQITIADLKKEISTATMTHKSLQVEIDALNMTLEAAEHSRQQWENMAKAEKERAAGMRQQLTDTIESAEQIKHERTNLALRNEELSQELLKTQNRLQHAMEECATIAERSSGAVCAQSEKLEATQSELTLLKATVQRQEDLLRDQLERFASEIETLRSDRDSALRACAQKNEYLEESTATLDKETKKTSELTAQLLEAEHHIKAARAEIAERDKALDFQAQRLNALEEEMKAATAADAQKADEIEQLRATIALRDAAVSTLASDCERHLGHIAELQRAIERERDDVGKLNSAIGDKDKQIAELEDAIAAAEATANNVRRSLGGKFDVALRDAEAVRSERERLEMELSGERAATIALRRELQNTDTAAKRKIAKLEEDLAEATNRVNVLTEGMDIMRRDAMQSLRTFTEKQTQLYRENSLLKAEKEKAEERLAKKEKQAKEIFEANQEYAQRHETDKEVLQKYQETKKAAIDNLKEQVARHAKTKEALNTVKDEYRKLKEKYRAILGAQHAGVENKENSAVGVKRLRGEGPQEQLHEEEDENEKVECE